MNPAILLFAVMTTLQTLGLQIQALVIPKRLRAQGALGAIIGLGVASIALLLIIIVVTQVDSNAPTLTGQGNTTYESASTQIYNALNLAPIVLIVIVAGVVIGILVVFSRGTGGE